jgi:hypothetical protein
MCKAPTASPPSILGIQIVVDPDLDPSTISLKNAQGETLGRIINIGLKDPK